MVNSLYSFRDPSCEYLNCQHSPNNMKAHQIQLIFYAGGPVQGDFRTMKRRRRRAPHWDTSFLRSWRIFGERNRWSNRQNAVDQTGFLWLVGSEPGLPWSGSTNNITCGRSLTNRSCFLVDKKHGTVVKWSRAWRIAWNSSDIFTAMSGRNHMEPWLFRSVELMLLRTSERGEKASTFLVSGDHWYYSVWAAQCLQAPEGQSANGWIFACSPVPSPGWDVGMLIVSDQNILRQRPPITVFDLDSSNVMNICLFGYVWMICHSKWMLPLRDEWRSVFRCI